MNIVLNEITDRRIPFIEIEYDSTNAVAGPSQQPYKGLILGYKTSAGSATADEIYSITSEQQAINLFGAGSQLHNMANFYFKDPRVTDLSMAAVTEPSGAKSTGDITFTGTATASGTINLYIGGRRVTASVAIGDTAAEIASAIVSAITAKTDLAVTAAVNGGDDTQVDVTAKNFGPMGDAIRFDFNLASDEETPAGITTSTNAMSGGSGDPTLTTLITNMGETQYNGIVSPWIDSTTLGALKDEMESRGSAARMVEGMLFAATVDTVSTANTLGNSYNSKFLSITNVRGCPNLPYEIAASLLKKVMVHGSIDPARPFQTLELTGVTAPKVADRLSPAERESHLNNGIATMSVTNSGEVLVERLITTYKQNPAGADDIAYLDVNTLLTLSYLRYDFRNSLKLKFPRHKIANVSDRIAAGQPVLTPLIAKAHAIDKFQSWASKVLVEDIKQFKDELIVERNADDPNRMDFLLPANLANQFRQAGIQLGFKL